ncbi:MAG: hypothetical protein ACRDP8_14635, partial [Actinopolymorphaceae bacterium]
SYVEFTPDLLDDLTLRVDGSEVHGGVFLQAYEPTTGTATGWYADGKVAAVDHAFGNGRTRLVGTFPSVGYHRHQDQGTRSYFARLLDFAGHRQRVRVSDPRVTARVHDGDGGRYLWLLNPVREPVRVTATLAATAKAVDKLRVVWGGEESALFVDGHSLDVNVPARDAVVVELS